MERFAWNEAYSVGIPTIDEQHKNFFRITNDLLEAVERPEIKKEDLMAIAQELEHYALYHLATEEKYFDEWNYKDAPEHKTEHNYYRTTIADLRQRLYGENTDLKNMAREIAAFSAHWLSHHILVVDKKYTPFLKEHNVY